MTNVWLALDDAQRRLIVDMAEGLNRQIDVMANSESDLVTNVAFFNRFTNGLLIHHATHRTPLKKENFETLVRDSAHEAGWSAVLGPSATHPGADITVQGVAFSLKTEAARRISATQIHISKFRESAATKPYTLSGEYAQYISTTVVQHLKQYERVLMLRARTVKPAIPRRSRRATQQSRESNHGEATDAPSDPFVGIEYSLVEIPIDLLRRIGLITAETIEVGTTGSARATVTTEDGTAAFTLYFDGSDNKIQIQHLDINLCRVHGVWRVPIFA